MINLLTKESISRILQPYEDLLKNFDQEVDKESVNILLKYLELVNNYE